MAGLGGGMALAAILLWYIGIGVLAAVGAVTISRARFSPRFEQIFFALLLIPIDWCMAAYSYTRQAAWRR
jgi:hypothetical protein